MSDWLCIDEDSPALEDYIAETVAEAVAKVASLLDEQGIGADDPQRQAALAKVAAEIEARSRTAIAKVRQLAAGETPANLN